MPCSKQKSSQHLSGTLCGRELPTKPPTKPTKTMCLSLRILSFRLVIRVTPLVTHNISVTKMCVLLQHVFTLKQCFRQVLEVVHQKLRTSQGFNLRKAFGGWFSCVWKPYTYTPTIRATCHMIPAFQNVATRNYVWMLAKSKVSSHVSLDKTTINYPSAQKKTRNLKGTIFHFHDYLCKSTSN